MRKRLILLALLFVPLIGCEEIEIDLPQPIVDPCDGPMMCFTEDWAGKYALLADRDDNLYLLGSDGVAIVFVGPCANEDGDTAIIGLGAPAYSCRLGSFNYGFIDYNSDGSYDGEVANVTGEIGYCTVNLDTDRVEFDLKDAHWVVDDIDTQFLSIVTLSPSGAILSSVPLEKDQVDVVKGRFAQLQYIMDLIGK